MTKRREKARTAGATLVEVMLAVLLLAVLAVAGGAFVYRSRADVALQKYKRAAVEVADAQMERLMGEWTYTEVEALVGAPLSEDVSLNGVGGYSMTTTVTDGGTGADGCLGIAVEVEYRRGTGDSVRLRTLRGQ